MINTLASTYNYKNMLEYGQKASAIFSESQENQGLCFEFDRTEYISVAAPLLSPVSVSIDQLPN